MGIEDIQRLEDTVASYDGALALRPDDAEAHCRRGDALKDLKRFEEAVSSYDQAIALRPDFAEAYANRAVALRHLKRLDEAIVCYDRAIALRPDHAEAYSQRGATLKALKRYDEALASYDKAIELRPGYAEAYNNRGNALNDLKRWDEAVASYDKAVALRPNYAEAYNNRGNALRGLKRLSDALGNYDRAIELKPDIPQIYCNRGRTLFALGRLDEAILSYDKAIALKPDYADALVHRGNALRDLKRFEEAVSCYDKVVALKPESAEAYSNRGNALKDLRRLEEALSSYDKAIALNADFAEVRSNRGNVLQDLGRPQQAVASYDEAIALKPDYAEAYNNRGLALQDGRRFEEAIASFEKAIALKPDYAEAWLNTALVHLLIGEFDVGWRAYEARKRTKAPVGIRQHTEPLWLGESDLSGKTILVEGEQGFGDTIQFCRYLRPLDAAGARVLFAPQNSLRTLMQSLDTKAQLVDGDDPTLRFDFYCPLMSLPLAFKTEIATIPSGRGYLGADPAKIDAWTVRLGAKGKPRIGIAWSGSTAHRNDHNRSIDLEKFRRCFDERFQLISLQRDIRDGDSNWIEKANIVHFGDALSDFSDTAALCQLMDLVVTVDTSVAHLAGALGMPTWVLLPWMPDWRWMLDRDDSPWYPSLRLFRQTVRGEWQGVLQRVQQELASHFPTEWRVPPI
jgi:tetratricopeptide (TPR) repeat protein